MEPCREGFPELELCETKENGDQEKKKTNNARLGFTQHRNKIH